MEELIKAENIRFSYNEKPFIENIGFSLGKGEIMSIVGRNGCGKSTLLKILSSFLKADSGKVFFKGKDLKTMKADERAKNIAVIYQNTDCRFPFTCFQIVTMGLYPHNHGKLIKKDIDFISNIMEKTDTLKFADKKITQLSGGEMQRVLIARALAQKPLLLLLDEAMSGFDIAVKIKMTDIIRDIVKNTGMSVISVQHDLNAVFKKSDCILAMKNGKMLYFDECKKLLKKEFFCDVFDIDVDISNGGNFTVKM